MSEPYPQDEFNSRPVFLIPEAGPPPTRSKDEIRFQYLGLRELVGQPASHWYRATNMTSGHTYHLFFFLTGAGAVAAECDCPARKICKHIIKGWATHSAAIDTGYIAPFKTEDRKDA
jgi:hypothetical protein